METKPPSSPAADTLPPAAPLSVPLEEASFAAASAAAPPAERIEAPAFAALPLMAAAYAPLERVLSPSAAHAAAAPADGETKLYAEGMPKVLEASIDYIYNCANENLRDAKRDIFFYWVLKVPVIVASAGYGALLHFGLDHFLAVAGAVAGACAMIDGICHPGSLRNSHHRAGFALRALADDLVDRWNAAILRKKATDAFAAQLVDEGKRRKAALWHYLEEIETMFDRDAKHESKRGQKDAA